MKFLAVDTTFSACSAALLEDDTVIAHYLEIMDRGHAESLAPMVGNVMEEAGWDYPELDRLAITTGPGTFTGQRIGLAYMRALKVALKKPLTGVTSLDAMVAQAMEQTGATQAAAIHDARRGEVYLGTDKSAPELLTFEAAVEKIRAVPGPMALAGTAAKAVSEAVGGNVVMTNILAPDAVWVAKLAAKLPADDSIPAPLYLRAPDAKLPKKKI